MDWAGLVMGARQVAEAHEELPNHLAAGEAEGLFEQFDPVGLVERVMGVEPLGEAAVARA
jgi:hypothetical protein